MGRRPAEAEERRRVLRAKTSLMCRLIHSGETCEGEVSSLSSTGAFVRASVLPPLDAVVDLFLLLPGSGGPLKLTSTVRWWGFGAGQEEGVGLEFLDGPQGDRDLIVEYLRSTTRTEG